MGLFTYTALLAVLTLGSPADGELTSTTFTCGQDTSLAGITTPDVRLTSGGKPYYVIGNYECVDSDGEPDGSCRVETRHKDSCAAACNAHRADVRSRNVCQECVKGRRYSGRTTSGKVSFNQGGPCRGVTC